MTFLHDLVYRDKRLECLHFVRQWLPSIHPQHGALFQISCRACFSHFHRRPERGRALVIPRIYNATPNMLAYDL